MARCPGFPSFIEIQSRDVLRSLYVHRLASFFSRAGGAGSKHWPPTPDAIRVAAVARRHDAKLGRQVALKVLPHELAADAGRRERFEREARAIASLNHPNIVVVHSIEQADGTSFLTMEYIEGKPLADLIPKRGLPLDRLLKIAIPLADAVGAAHHRGVVHRDLKPANVMVTTDNRVRVLDFGLAKLQEDVSAGEGLPTQELTGEGRIMAS